VPQDHARRSSAAAPATDLRERVLAAMRELLRERRFESISVAEVIAAAAVSRASFYFYFPSKQAVLAELVRRAVARGQQAAEPWTGGRQDPASALRAGVSAGASLWRENAGVLRAIVESWGSDDQLRELWLAQMETFTEAAVTRINADPEALRALRGQDVRAVAGSLTWLGERLYYLAALGMPPYDDEELLVDVLTHMWLTTLYP
jgi:AcrR family transcriptional regulator